MSTGRDSHIRTDLWFFSGCHNWNKLSLCLSILKPSLKGTVHQKKGELFKSQFSFLCWRVILGTTRGRVNDRRSFIFEWTIPLRGTVYTRTQFCFEMPHNSIQMQSCNADEWKKGKVLRRANGETHRNCQSFSSYLHRKTKSSEAEHKNAFCVNQPLVFKQTAVRKYNDRHHTGECQTRQNMNKQD